MAEVGSNRGVEVAGVGVAEGHGPGSIMQRRELFWQNVMQEILSGLSAAAAANAGRLSASPVGAAGSGSPTADLFDGRLAVITKLGQRIAIADIFPLFACSLPMNARDSVLAMEVQCTVYQVRTPAGEVFTVPLHEIAAFHTLSAQLVERLQQAAGGPSDTPQGDRKPFGFAAFTSLTKAGREQS